jgi:hypothetical protein
MNALQQGLKSREMFFLVQCWHRTDENNRDYIKKTCIQQCWGYIMHNIYMYIYQTVLKTQQAFLYDCPSKMFNHGNKPQHDCKINTATNCFQQHLF